MLEDYTDSLAVATEAALAAGATLRDEFLRAGGPLGSGGHCDADLWAERLIRERLTESFPDWAYRGEETGFRPGALDERHMWLVDPNDGTSSYLKGMRGTSVSIALLRDNEPVLGVVYAYASPDSSGDLFNWAEGCGPLRRNGISASPGWPTRPGPRDVVILSQSGDRSPEANLACASPARYRTVPSIAYRLALVAAGEGVAAVSLNDPAPWDYAGGHALLKGVGGELVGEDGRPIGYSQRGSTFTRFCFGGAPGFVQELAKRPWDKALGGHHLPLPPPDLPFPVRLEPGQAIGDDGLLSRARGTLMGQLCGDALGGQVEFESAASLRSHHPGGLRQMEDGGRWRTMAGQPTDDSEMALVLARTLVVRGRYDPSAVAGAYHYWHRSGPFDEGGTTSQALGAIRDPRTADNDARAAASRDSQANGSLMRISPLGIFGHALPADALAEMARQDSALTHPHPVCQEASALFVVALARAISEGGTPEEVYKDVKRWASFNCRDVSVLTALEESVANPPADYQKHAGWVLVALQNAFYQLLHAGNAEEGIVATAMAGGDTDTNAAIAGALLGSVHGYAALPLRWRQMVLTCRPLAGHSPTRHPRPYPFWPADASELAEKLAAISPSARS